MASGTVAAYCTQGRVSLMTSEGFHQPTVRFSTHDVSMSKLTGLELAVSKIHLFIQTFSPGEESFNSELFSSISFPSGFYSLNPYIMFDVTKWFENKSFHQLNYNDLIWHSFGFLSIFYAINICIAAHLNTLTISVEDGSWRLTFSCKFYK